MMPLPELEQPCPMCGTPVMVTAKECSFCGEPLKHHFQLNEEEIRAELIRQYRREMRALTGFFLIVGTIAAVVGGSILKANLPFHPRSAGFEWGFLSVGMLALLCGTAWIACGFASFQKKMSGVRAGLIIGYLVIALNLILVFIVPVFICGAALLIPVIRQCYRVQTISRKMETAGVPLTYKV